MFSYTEEDSGFSNTLIDDLIFQQTFFQDNPRIEGAFRKYIHRAAPSQTEDSYDLIVCHGNVIRYFVCR